MPTSAHALYYQCNPIRADKFGRPFYNAGRSAEQHGDKEMPVELGGAVSDAGQIAARADASLAGGAEKSTKLGESGAGTKPEPNAEDDFGSLLKGSSGKDEEASSPEAPGPKGVSHKASLAALLAERKDVVERQMSLGQDPIGVDDFLTGKAVTAADARAPTPPDPRAGGVLDTAEPENPTHEEVLPPYKASEGGPPSNSSASTAFSSLKASLRDKLGPPVSKAMEHANKVGKAVNKNKIVAAGKKVVRENPKAVKVALGIGAAGIIGGTIGATAQAANDKKAAEEVEVPLAEQGFEN
jgi:hypothetical protein